MITNYEMWLTYNAEKQKIQFPVLPESIQVKWGSNNESMDITGLGDITIMQSRPAIEISWSSFFPYTTFPGCKVDPPKRPLGQVEIIGLWKESTTPVHFICTKCDLDMYCTIEDFTYEEYGGDIGTLQYSITLKEYREVSVRKVTVKSTSSGTTASASKSTTRVNTQATPQTYTVVSGDCLYNIAKKYYGDGSKYTIIYEVNKSVIGSNPNLIYPGQVLTIPEAAYTFLEAA